ncbi:hypothetical protein COS54_01335 [Candidatus Shapirobacteria bacterium CG03_land_8_20_14_0_80_39_12]|uniref:ATP-grasp domain-containing protein n=1 Tax=Candidatus Shapirobacteria bacterium CG03_land_8_20_14_0_80_39_12 TaxID=1974879 RepID=A0A2M7BDW5_9BACT|nr:MAG: hypothetical protein COS54_01335 [Candidatus Shapirobacteria bacterium CG03_land_8_20_14_0_80_39_12]
MEKNLLEIIKEPVFYVTNNVGRGIGLENLLPNFHIVCLDDHPLVDILKKKGISVFCLERAVGKRNFLLRNAGMILSSPEVLSFIKEKAKRERPNILFFKPQKKIEILAQKYGFNLLGNLVEVNRIFEDKVEFFEICQKKGIKTSAGEIIVLSKIVFKEKMAEYSLPLVIQFGRGWAGNTTFFIREESDLLTLQRKYGQKEVKLSRFIKGITLLNNAVIYQNKILAGNPAIQIKANRWLTSAEGGTGGRSWPIELTNKETRQIGKITSQVGEVMMEKKYRGFFGLDFLLSEDGEVFLSEDNARLTASVPFFTKLEQKEGGFPLLGYHLLAFFPEKIIGDFAYRPSAVSGSEITVKNSRNIPLEITGEVKTGIYDSRLSFKKEAYFLESAGKDDLWLEPAARSRIVNPEIELCKIDTFDKVCDGEGNLLPEYQDLIEKIKERLKERLC